MRTTRLMIGLAAVSLPAFASAAAIPLPAQYAERLKAPTAEAVRAAAGFIVAAQRDLAAPEKAGTLSATWPFERGGTTAAPNAAGIVSRAVVAGYALTRDEASKAAALAWGNARTADLAAGRLLFDPDVEGLAVLAQVTGEARFAKAAKDAWAWRHSGAGGREIVERLFLLRKGAPSLVGYDAANAMRAALAVGDGSKAREIADALAETEKRWNVSDPHGFHLTSRAAVLEVLERLPAGLPLRGSLRSQVLGSQGRDGSWGLRTTQATAYSVRALRAVGSSEAQAAVERGVRFLRSTQLASGGWATFNDYLPEPFVGETVYEVTAEVILALVP